MLSGSLNAKMSDKMVKGAYVSGLQIQLGFWVTVRAEYIHCKGLMALLWGVYLTGLLSFACRDAIKGDFGPFDV